MGVAKGVGETEEGFIKKAKQLFISGFVVIEGYTTLYFLDISKLRHSNRLFKDHPFCSIAAYTR
jgi:hypothetical protein